MYSCELARPPCQIDPPDGPFDARLIAGPRTPNTDSLPATEGSAVLIQPAHRHRWSPKVGLVESLDGSLLLHGVLRGNGTEPVGLALTVLVGYEAQPARLAVWTPDRRDKLAEAAGSHLYTELESPAAAFDIELPRGSIDMGRWQEIQTVITMDGASPDVRRWTVYGGPAAPDGRACMHGDRATDRAGGRSSFHADGTLVVGSPPGASLAVVPLDPTGRPAETARFVRLRAQEGAQIQFGAETEVAAVFESPFAGPDTDWISNFWSRRRLKAVTESKVR